MTSAAATPQDRETTTLDPALTAVIANRLDGIVREMTSTLMRAGRSAVISVARDFSCSIVTADDQLLASAEGLPVHIFGTHLQTAEMRRVHPDFREGDAFLDNDPYVGNTHHADHTILVPVFVGGEHLFTAAAKSHQADLGNSEPTQFMAFAKDIYQEGALSFPCVQVQRDYRNIDDVIRMCRRRIRVPDQWYGDFLATLGAARTAERRLKELVDKYGVELIREFISEWFDYSERRIDHALRQLPSGTYERTGVHDSFGPAPRIPIKARITVDAENGRVEVDLRDNPDCLEAGLNLSRATAINSAITGIFYNLDPDIPHNAGSFRRITVHLRDNCVVGIPQHPTCCSVATTNVADRLVNLVAAAFEGAGPQAGVAEGGTGLGLSFSVISGRDWRTGSPYINQILLGNNGGPATNASDGWLTWTIPVTAGLLYRDSVEIDEQKYPLHVESLRLMPDSGGPGRQRGGLAAEVVIGTRGGEMRVIWAGDGHETPAAGVHGGGSGSLQRSERIAEDGSRTPLPGLGAVDIMPGERVAGIGCGGGGFGDPLERDPAAVLLDVLEGWVSIERARDVYGVVFTGHRDDESLAVDGARTEEQRQVLAAERGSSRA
ncbi:MAG: hydantoinase B/oxoprolinase family protein [Solirubrobacteraceae bacterium]|nr:hydantoinase B/oxoprolinase family protein [Solirubrobacteraceae bacterium]